MGLAFAFVPWLSKDDKSDGTVTGRLRAGSKRSSAKFENVKEKASDKAKALGIAPEARSPRLETSPGRPRAT